MNKNYAQYRHHKIDTNLLISALEKDKKNSATQLRLILPDEYGRISVGLYDNNKLLVNAINDYFALFAQEGDI